MHNHRKLTEDLIVKLGHYMGMLFISSRHRHILILLFTFGLIALGMKATGQSLIINSSFEISGVRLNNNSECEITIPSEGYVYYDPDIICIEVVVTDPNDILKVDFFLDSLHLGTDYAPPFHNMNLFNSPMGQFNLRAVARHYNGLTTTSLPVHIIVRCVREDLDSNGVVNINDFLLLLGSFGLHCVTCHEDLNQDGAVNTLDYLRFLGNLGLSCN